MSEWTHSICDKCWKRRQTRVKPITVAEPSLEKCCFCGDVTQNGIYTRHDPEDPKLKCGGNHEPEMIAG